MTVLFIAIMTDTTVMIWTIGMMTDIMQALTYAQKGLEKHYTNLIFFFYFVIILFSFVLFFTLSIPYF